MGKINGCLKCLFIFFNVLFAIIGCLLIYGAVRASTYNQQLSVTGGPAVGWSWVFAIGVLGISCLGIYAGCSEKGLALKILKESLHSASSEVAKIYVENDDMRTMLEDLQQSVQCCGVVSAKDWGDVIPNSCQCSSHAEYRVFGSECMSRPQGTQGPDQIYKQTCGDFIFSLADFVFKIFMGFLFGFAVTALLGLLVSLLMIHQVKRYDSAGGASIAMKGY
ncbi:uncharacterized protein LOC122871558 isoform X2 [Siniperca chuatsi]|uniref:uncharacterized protein LOC122871558 isoform X2 n=1 Tax=Siniperca chuatsi TaxID=119488 RepID=UPI001CE0DD23|nr:uncharacterized protein LOC122871558 isoform X2 [Siniperca chuatsi]